jgi:transcriptional accessory protein Tex/SPT6
MPRGAKPQEHYREGDTIRVRILRIDEGEMKIGLSGLDEAGQPLGAAAVGEAAASEATPAPAEAAPPTPAEHAEAEPAPKKRRSRKKAEETPPKE